MVSLRSTLTIALSGLATLAVAGAAALILVSSLLHRAAVQMGQALESVAIAHDLEVRLLLHERAEDPLLRLSMAGRLGERLSAARELIGGQEEAALLQDVERTLHEYLDESGARPPAERQEQLERAYDAIARLVRLNMEQAAAAQVSAATWDRTGNYVGTGIALLLVLGVGATVTWLRLRALRPVLGIGDAMEQFSGGNLSARAPESGPMELSEMARRFNDMASALQRQRERQLAFLAGVAHDLRNPLQGISGSIMLIESTTRGPDDAAIQRATAVLKRQVDRLDRMASDILDSASIEAGHLEMHVAEVDLRRVAEDAVDLFRSSAGRRRLLLRLPASQVVLMGDTQRLEQVLTNLLSNAIKYSPEETDVEVALRETEKGVTLSVRDHGPGIAREDLARIFEPFSRTTWAARSSIPGAGIGLSVVRRIVEAHGGRIAVDSEPDRGTTFEVRLPQRSGGTTAAA